MKLTKELTQLNHIVRFLFEREFERAHWECRDIPDPAHVDPKYREIRDIYYQLLKVTELNNERLVREVNKDGN